MGGALPVWCDVLIAAEAWHKAPWEIAGGSKIVWWIRWRQYMIARNAKREQLG